MQAKGGWEVFADIVKSVAALWPLIIVIFIIWWRSELKPTLDAITRRIIGGEAIKIGIFELKGLIINTPQDRRGENIGGLQTQAATEADFSQRQNLRYQSHLIRLVHKVLPSGEMEFPFVVSVFVKQETPDYPGIDTDVKVARLNDINRVEYYFGKYFGTPPNGSWFIVGRC